MGRQAAAGVGVPPPAAALYVGLGVCRLAADTD